MPSDKNMYIKKYGKISKYKESEVEIEKMWYCKTTIIPIIIGALDTIKKDQTNRLTRCLFFSFSFF